MSTDTQQTIVTIPRATENVTTFAARTLSSEEEIAQVNEFLDNANVYASITSFSIDGKYLYVRFNNGLVINCGEVRGKSIKVQRNNNGIYYKYEGEDDSKYQSLFTIDEIRLHYSDLTEAQKAELRQPAVEAAQHMPFIDSNGFWNIYNYSTGAYEVTTYQAKGEVVTVTPSLRQNKLYVTVNKSLTEG